jgi:endonuclease YncB( thermonuclease family)
MKKLFLLCGLLLLCSGFKVRDGDSITQVIYRLAYIDAPELHQTCHVGGQEIPIGENARIALDKYMHDDLTVCKFREYDIHHTRPVVDCGFNLQMVRSGNAICYDNYMTEAEQVACHDQQDKAKAENLGIWKCSDFVTPENFRHHK